MTALSSTGGRDVHTVQFPDADPPDDIDVLVVGAGPVGLSAALELTGRGVSVAVVDRARQATLARAGAMGHTPRTVEHFRRWGVLQSIRDEWTFPPEWNHGIRLVTSLVGHELVPNRRPAFVGAGAPRLTGGEGIRRPQTVLQKVFLRRLAAGGVTVAGGWQVAELRQDETGVDVDVVRVLDAGDRRRIRARYVIGADGGSSTVRRLAGIEREGEYARAKRLRLIVRTGDISDRVGPAPSGTNIVVNAQASGFLAAVSHREWRVYAGPFPLDHEPSEDELLETAAAAFGFGLELELVSATTFYDATRIARNFRGGRVLLAGDAAHVRTPGGNLGEGFGDVTNLGWKLAAVLDGAAPDHLLDSYDEERRPHNWRIADHALAQAIHGQDVLARIRSGGVPDDTDISPAAQRRRAEISELIGAGQSGRGGLTYDERYDASSVIWHEDGQSDTEPAWQPDRYDDDPRPGHRAPNGQVDPYGSTLYDRIGNAWALLVLTDDRTVELAVAAEATARSLPFTVVHLTEASARDLYGPGAVLVRPDQHVAWRGERLPDGGAAAVLDHVLGRHGNGRKASMTEYKDFSGPQGLRTRGTVLVLPGRGETADSYGRFGRRIAADSYRVRVLPSPTSAPAAQPSEQLEQLADELTAALRGLGDDPVRPVIFVGSDAAAAGLAALVAGGPPDAAWWPDALILAALPGFGAHEVAADWQAELDIRSHCPVHRGVLDGDAAVERGTLSGAVDAGLLDQAYGSTADIPTLLLVGDADPLADHEALIRAAKSLPAARLSVVHGAHHDVLNDLQHRAVAAEVVAFLEVVRNGRPLEAIVSAAPTAW